MSDAHTRRVRVLAAAMFGALAGLAVLTTRTGLDWVDRPFPGFFVLRNRVVASISLPGWPVDAHPEAFQAAIVAIDGTPVASSRAVYEYVRSRPAGTDVAYTFERRGTQFVRTIASRTFAWRDALLLFGVYLFDGLVFAAIGLGVWALSPKRPVTWALESLGSCVGVYTLTAIDLYGPHRFFRLHALAEAFLPATFLHLALLFPVRRVRTPRALAVSYAPFALLAVAYQLWLDDPARYPTVHGLATLGVIVTGLFLLTSVVVGYVRAPSQLVRHRVRVVMLGLVAGFAPPAVVLTYSAFTDGQVPVNVIGYSVFLFPLAVAYAVTRRDLFAIDALVQRGLYYTVLSGVVTVAYFVLAAVASQGLHVTGLAGSPLFSLAFTLVALFTLPALRDRLQRVVDLVFGRDPYDADDVLAKASAALGSTLDLRAILDVTLAVPFSILRVAHAIVLLRDPDGGYVEATRVPERTAGDAALRLPDEAPLVALLRSRGDIVVRENLPQVDPDTRAAVATTLATLDAALVVPLACQGALVGFLACGPKRAGTSFAAGDATMLRTFANQVALSLQNARTYMDLQVLNADLERRVTERTQQVAASNDRLATSLAQLETAYRTLQASQEQLVSAEKMAAFGRLAAGIAHEINTPLGAALNGLQIAREMIADCADDGSGPAEERRAELARLGELVRNVEEWTRKATSYIRSIKAHSRGAGGAATSFSLAQLVERDLQPLLMHRLRLAGGELDCRIAPGLPDLFGDSSRLGQVLANLITNAIDACEGLPRERQTITIDATCGGRELVLHVVDRGPGIPLDARPRVFDEFFTTKPPGKGTGLGLSIARDIVTAEFGGTLACTATGAHGTTFTIRLPVQAAGGSHRNAA